MVNTLQSGFLFVEENTGIAVDNTFSLRMVSIVTCAATSQQNTSAEQVVFKIVVRTVLHAWFCRLINVVKWSSRIGTRLNALPIMSISIVDAC